MIAPNAVSWVGEINSLVSQRQIGKSHTLGRTSWQISIFDPAVP